MNPKHKKIIDNFFREFATLNIQEKMELSGALERFFHKLNKKGYEAVVKEGKKIHG